MAMIEEDFEKEVKVVVLGNGCVGKSSMIRRYCMGTYTDEYKKTIGVDFMEKTRWIDSIGEDVRVMVWDTAGQEEFDTITRTYYRGYDFDPIARRESPDKTLPRASPRHTTDTSEKTLSEQIPPSRLAARAPPCSCSPRRTGRASRRSRGGSARWRTSAGPSSCASARTRWT
tara:strand:+ start:282 stop:797 length:516 start_codon:yes stop_codon:yes gene_type:complete